MQCSDQGTDNPCLPRTLLYNLESSQVGLDAHAVKLKTLFLLQSATGSPVGPSSETLYPPAITETVKFTGTKHLRSLSDSVISSETRVLPLIYVEFITFYLP